MAVVLVVVTTVLGFSMPAAAHAWDRPAHAGPALRPGAPSTVAATSTPPTWQTTWTSPMDLLLGTADDATARDIAQVAVAGTSIELQLSNQWGNTPLTFGAVTVGQAASGPTVVPGTIVPVTFAGGATTVTIPAHGRVTSLPVAMTVTAGESLAVSIWVPPGSYQPVSVHYCCQGRTDSYTTPDFGGNRTESTSAAGFSLVAGASWQMRWLSAVSVSGAVAQGTVVAFGDSITEGFNNDGVGWPGLLQSRIDGLPPSEQMSVANEGIAGNTLTLFPANVKTFQYVSGGQPGVVRLPYDALDLPGVKDVILFLGTNDIWFGGGGNPKEHNPPGVAGTAPLIIAAMQSVIASVHAAGMQIFGVTLLPRLSSSASSGLAETWTPADQATLEAVNAWILTPGNGFNGVFNLAAVMGDVYNGSCQPTVPFPPYFTDDNLHPDTAGQTAMADAIPTSVFGIGEAPQLPQVVHAVPTPGCPAAEQAAAALAAGSTPASTTTVPPQTTAPSRRPPHRHVPRRPTGTPLWPFVLVGVAVLVALTAATLRIIALRRRARRRKLVTARLDRLSAGRPAGRR